MSQKVTYRLLTFLAIVSILLVGCGGGKKTVKDQIIGKWEGNDPSLGGNITFEFLKDGKAKINVGAMTLDITYKWVDDDTFELTIDTGSGTPDTTQMDAKIEGNKLLLTAEGQTVEFTKK
jgi:Family of unknown function (DUF5640)